MKDVFIRIKRILSSERIGKLLFAAAVAATATAIALPRGTSASPPNVHAVVPPVTSGTVGDLLVTATLSQSKLVQGSDGTFYLQVSVDTPEAKSGQTARTPVDMVVVLDRSGSMAAENRLPYAKSAINELLSRLTPDDRFGLVTFDTSANVVSPLTSVTAEFRSREQALVDALAPGGSTNLSTGLQLAKALLAAPSGGRTRKVVLMSDGEANVGIVDPLQLGQIARSFSHSEIIVSTIGMGLGFNEVLMASLADHGMGNYSYLESLAALGTILQKDLQDTRTVYASSSGLELKLPPSFTLTDSAGYPQESGAAPGSIRLLTGQLMSGAKKNFFLSFAAPTASTGTFPLGEMSFHYTAGGFPHTVKLDGSKLTLAVVEPARSEEAIASVDHSVLKKSWVLNNLGRIQQEVSAELRAGNAPGAKEKISAYRRQVAAAESQYKVKLVDEKLEKDAKAMDAMVDSVMSAGPAEAETKKNRAAKALQASGMAGQRSN